MEPSLRDGDLVLGWKWARSKVGDVVVVKTLERPLIKRIVRLERDKIWLEGDNAAASTDSRQLGNYLRQDIIAKMIIKF